MYSDVDAEHRQLGHRADLHLAEHEPADAGQLRLVDGDLGLVGDLDGHGQRPCRRGAVGPHRARCAGGRELCWEASQRS